MLCLMSIHPTTWMEQVFASPAQIRLLRVLARDPSKSWTEREAGAAAGLPPSTSHQVFQRLLSTGLLEIRRAGRSHIVRLRGQILLANKLHELFEDESQTLDAALQDAIQQMPESVSVYLFGSSAREEARASSDVDVLIVGPTRDAAESAADRVHSVLRQAFPAKVQVVALARSEARQRRFQSLLRAVLLEGRHLAGPSLKGGAS